MRKFLFFSLLLSSLLLSAYSQQDEKILKLHYPNRPIHQPSLGQTQHYRVNWITDVSVAPGLEQRAFYSSSAEARISYYIYFPKAYSIQNQRRFPVIYWLHGSGGGVKGLPEVVKFFDDAINAGKMSPAIIVFPNAMVALNGTLGGMWVDSKDGRVQLEQILMTELFPLIDREFRTIGTPDKRLLQGFSMGGYGTARLGFKYENFFGAIAFLAGGPLQQVFTVEDGPEKNKGLREKTLQYVYGNDQNYFKELSPWVIAEQKADYLRQRSIPILQVIGDQDFTFNENNNFHIHLTQLGIAHEFIIVPNVGHDTIKLLEVLETKGYFNWIKSVFGE